MSVDEVYSVEVDNLSLEFPLLKSSANQIINLLKGKWGLVFRRNKFKCLKDISFKRSLINSHFLLNIANNPYNY